MSAIIEKARKLRPLIEKAVQGLNNSDSLKATLLFAEWKIGTKLEAGEKVRFGDKLYRVKDGQGHTTQADWAPDIAVSLFEEVCENADGTIDNPIPYDGNMVLESDKYYIQGDVVYRCTRDTGTAVYHALADLVGLYVETINNK
jgi:hypothetical protein